jgi:hypothetical protein
MSKKTSKKSKKEDDLMVKVIGTPTLLLLPARNYKFKVYPGEYTITIPKKGFYKDIDDKFFTDDDGEFNILDKDVLYVPSLSKVLFATSKYPDLEDSQAFAPMIITVKEEEIDIVGHIIEMLKGD